MTTPIDAKPKRKIRRRDVKRAVIITVYAFVAIVTIVSMAAPGLI